MLINYIKIAWKVLLRRKFFTSVSLFGISFTILVLLIAASILDHAVSPTGPEVNSSRILIADKLAATDSLKRSVWISSPGYMLLDKYARNLKTPELVSVYSETNSYFTYLNGRKLNFSYKFTDPEFWQMYKFKFLNGNAYSRDDYEKANKVAVISQHTAEKYFGETDVRGRYIEVDGTEFRIIGVVENVSKISDVVYSDIYIPSTTSKDDIYSEFMGNYNLSILAYGTEDFNTIRNEWHSHLKAAIASLPPDMSNLTILKCLLKSRDEKIAAILFEENMDFDSQTTEDARIAEASGISNYHLFYVAVAGLMLLFMLLPSVNLVNINLSRMVERNSEIGVRKAFGATRKILVGQFITENIILTFIGGTISLILTTAALQLINESGAIMNAQLQLNYKVFIFGFITCIVLGFISGVYPAFRMSKLHPVEALRGGVK